MRWIGKHKLFVTVILVFLIGLTSLLTIVMKNDQITWVDNTVGSVVNTLFQPISKAARNITANIVGVFNYKNIMEENKDLKKEIAELEVKLKDSTVTAKQIEELDELKNILNYEDKNLINKFVTADIVSVDSTNWMNVFSIDVGEEEGIEVENVVMSGADLIGKVISTGKGWSKIATIMDESNKISFVLENNSEMLGVITGNEDGILTGYMVDSRAKIKEGDELVTSGMGIYPKGLSIGKISKVKYNSNRQLTMVEVSSFANFKKLQKVSVIL